MGLSTTPDEETADVTDRCREAQLWSWLRDALSKWKPLRDHDVQRIEDATKKGTPDVEGCILGETFWCELKVAHPRAGGQVRIEITTSQVRRARARRRAGGRSWVLIRVCGAIARLNRHYLVDGMDAEELLETVSLERLQQLSSIHADADAVFVLKTMAGK